MPLPTTAADWGPEITRNVAASNTYANTYRLSAEANALYNFQRCVNFKPTLTLSTDNGASWGTARLLIGTGAGGIRPYPRYCSNGVDRVDLIYTECHPATSRIPFTTCITRRFVLQNRRNLHQIPRQPTARPRRRRARQRALLLLRGGVGRRAGPQRLDPHRTRLDPGRPLRPGRRTDRGFPSAARRSKR